MFLSMKKMKTFTYSFILQIYIIKHVITYNKHIIYNIN